MSSVIKSLSSATALLSTYLPPQWRLHLRINSYIRLLGELAVRTVR